MKKHFLYTLLLTSAMIARDNPFAPTDAYLEEVARLMEQGEMNPKEFMQKNTKPQYEDMDSTLDIPSKKTKYTITMVPKEMKKTSPMKKTMEKPKAKPLSEESINAILHKKMSLHGNKSSKEKMMQKESSAMEMKEQIIYVKKRVDIPDEKISYKPLSFVNIDYTSNVLEIDATKYKVFKKFDIEKENKIILDFRAEDVKFYTKRKSLDNSNFKHITIGNHKKEKYFRIVISLAQEPSAYAVNYTDNKVSISKNP